MDKRIIVWVEKGLDSWTQSVAINDAAVLCQLGKKAGHRSRACTACWRGGKRGSLHVQELGERRVTVVTQKNTVGMEKKLVKGATQIAV